MAKKKSKAQINRMMKRAEARGETYAYNGNHEEPLPKASSQQNTGEAAVSKTDDKVLLEAATRLSKSLQDIETNSTSLTAKDRRSAKRKAHAIAVEETGGDFTADSLLEWLEEYQKKQQATATSKDHDKEKKNKTSEKGGRRQKNPYIVFIGQLSYDTTKESLFQYIQKELGKEQSLQQNDALVVSHETVQVRLLTDNKTNKSRGMAFVQLSNPELLYACLKLHQTFLEGRRINVERTTGGKRGSEARMSKIKVFREEQDEYIGSVVDTMLEEYYSNGSIQKGELDDGVIALCKRHSATVVQAGLERYVESNGRDMDNPSAYLSFLLGKLAEEGIYDRSEKQQQRQQRGDSSRKRDSHAGQHKRPRTNRETNAGNVRDSVLSREGVDMSVSATGADAPDTARDMSSIFPSFSRGRGK